jgi:hypothetical protein
VEPLENTTEPVGTPPAAATTAEYVTELPAVTELAERLMAVVDGTGAVNTPAHPQQEPPTGSPTMAAKPGPESATDDPNVPAPLGAANEVPPDQVPSS